MAKGRPTPRPRGRPALPVDKAKRHAVGIRTTKDIKDLLQRAAEAAGRSLAQEVEFRLERSFDRERTLAEDLADALGGPRAAALFRTLAGQAGLWSGDEAWLDDYGGFNTVRDMWRRTLDAIAPKMPDEIRQRIESTRQLLKSRNENDLSEEERARRRAVIARLAAADTSLPDDVRAEFAAAAAGRGSEDSDK